MVEFAKRTFEQPDESMASPGARFEVVRLGDWLVWRLTAEAGWRLSASESAGDDRECRSEHLFLLMLSGQLAVRLTDGPTREFGAGEFGSIPPGHETWVVGGQPAVAIGIDPQGAA
jgi:hypothetical protein